MKIKYFVLLLPVFATVFGFQTVKANEQNILLGVNYSIQQYTNNDLSENYMPSAAILRLGVEINRSFGVESRIGVGAISDTNDESGSSVEVESQSLLGVYGKAKLNLAHNANLYGLIGLSSFDVAVKEPGSKTALFTEEESSISVGLGLESRIIKKWLVNAEFMLYSPQDDPRLMAIEFGGAYLF